MHKSCFYFIVQLQIDNSPVLLLPLFLRWYENADKFTLKHQSQIAQVLSTLSLLLNKKIL